MNSNLVKSVSAVLTSVVLLVANPASSFANDKKTNDPIDAQVSVKYTGSNAKAVAFHLTFDNVKGESFWLVIKNEAGDVVYEEQFSGVDFNRNIFLDVEQNKISPTFIIRTNDQEVERVVSVNKKAVEAGAPVTKS